MAKKKQNPFNKVVTQFERLSGIEKAIEESEKDMNLIKSDIAMIAEAKPTSSKELNINIVKAVHSYKRFKVYL